MHFAIKRNDGLPRLELAKLRYFVKTFWRNCYKTLFLLKLGEVWRNFSKNLFLLKLGEVTKCNI